MAEPTRRALLRGLSVTGAGTLVSRVLGMLRDIATAYRFGAGPVMDSLVLALRAPDLFRRLFGEGVLASTVVPALSVRSDDRPEMWRLLSGLLAAAAWMSLAVVAVGEAACGAVWWRSGGAAPLPYGLTAALLPYVTLICLVAQLAAALQSLSRFAAPAFISCVLNLGWLLACGVAPWLASTLPGQAYVLAVGVLLSGLVQVMTLWWLLRREGFRWSPQWRRSRDDVRRATRRLLPFAAALSVTQINTALDGLLAWWLSWRGQLPSGAAAAAYFGERMFMLPVGVVGVAAATVAFPTLSRLAAERRTAELGRRLVDSLFWVTLLAAPASIGLAALSEPAVRLLLQRGEFSAEAALHSARVTAVYACGVWAFAALPLVVRCFLALQDARRPAWTGLSVIALHLAAALTLAPRLGTAGLAAATVGCAAVQLSVLLGLLSRRVPLPWRVLGGDLLRLAPGATAMALLAVRLGDWALLADGGPAAAARLAGAIGACAAAYLLLVLPLARRR